MSVVSFRWFLLGNCVSCLKTGWTNNFCLPRTSKALALERQDTLYVFSQSKLLFPRNCKYLHYVVKFACNYSCTLELSAFYHRSVVNKWGKPAPRLLRRDQLRNWWVRILLLIFLSLDTRVNYAKMPVANCWWYGTLCKILRSRQYLSHSRRMMPASFCWGGVDVACVTIFNRAVRGSGCKLCYPMTLPLSLRPMIDFPTYGMIQTCIALCVGHLRWSCLLAWNIWVTLSIFRNKSRADRAKRLRALTWAYFRSAHDGQIGCASLTSSQLFTAFSRKCALPTIWGSQYSSLKVFAGFLCECSSHGYITLDKQFTWYARSDVWVWDTHGLSVTYLCAGL